MKYSFFISLFLFCSLCTYSCSKDTIDKTEEIINNENDKEEENEDIKTERISDLLYVKKVGDNLYISAKLDANTDILYWFKRCMFNELFTFYRVGTYSNNSKTPTSAPDRDPSTVLNLAYSDNIGPFNISGHGWCGGNHGYMDGDIPTAYNKDYQISLNGTALNKDTLALVKDIKIRVINNILDPSKALKKEDTFILNELLCIETVDYSINRNSISVSTNHDFVNKDPVEISTYYGMQSMFEGETHTFTPNGRYKDWTGQASVSSFTKKEAPNFRRFIEKNTSFFQSTYLLNEGLGTHSEISDDDIIFIGNSSRKTYHKIIANKTVQKDNSFFWKGVYSWFRDPVIDNDDWFCYESVIDGKDAIFIDCKRKVSGKLNLPSSYLNRNFKIFEKDSAVTIANRKVPVTGIEIYSQGAGSCVIVFEQ